VLDFGSAQYCTKTAGEIVDSLQPPNAVLTQIFETTHEYAPEIDMNNQLQYQILPGRFDVYQLGCLLYHMLLDNDPPVVNRLFQYVPLEMNHLDDDVIDLLCGMLDQDQHTRYDIFEVALHPAFSKYQQVN